MEAQDLKGRGGREAIRAMKCKGSSNDLGATIDMAGVWGGGGIKNNYPGGPSPMGNCKFYMSLM